MSGHMELDLGLIDRVDKHNEPSRKVFLAKTHFWHIGNYKGAKASAKLEVIGTAQWQPTQIMKGELCAGADGGGNG